MCKLEITIDIKKQYAQIITVVLVILLSLVAVNAVAQDQGHEADDVWIKIPSSYPLHQNLEYSLQYGIDHDSLLSGEPWRFAPWGTGCWRSCNLNDGQNDGYLGCGQQRVRSGNIIQNPNAIPYICYLEWFSLFPDKDYHSSVGGIERIGNDWIMYGQNSEFIMNCLSINEPVGGYDCKFDP